MINQIVSIYSQMKMERSYFHTEERTARSNMEESGNTLQSLMTKDGWREMSSTSSIYKESES